MCGHRHVRGLMSMPSPSPSAPPPPPMTKEEEVKLMKRVMQDPMNMHGERRWVGLETVLALFVVGDVAIPELEQADMVKEEVVDEPPLAAWNPQLVSRRWGWSTTTLGMAVALGVVHG
ncbi:hypothetical protein D1007_38837 [Hordeum vulgare]|nr:hypothetical protein D1007_38837 [Hordeum vulgare]